MAEDEKSRLRVEKKEQDALLKTKAKLAKDLSTARKRTVTDAAKIIAKITPELQNVIRVMEEKDNNPPALLVGVIEAHVAQMTKFKADA